MVTVSHHIPDVRYTKVVTLNGDSKPPHSRCALHKSSDDFNIGPQNTMDSTHRSKTTPSPPQAARGGNSTINDGESLQRYPEFGKARFAVVDHFHGARPVLLADSCTVIIVDDQSPGKVGSLLG